MDHIHHSGSSLKHERSVRVRRLRIGLAAFAGLVLVVTGVLGGIATALSWDGLL